MYIIENHNNILSNIVVTETIDEVITQLLE